MIFLVLRRGNFLPGQEAARSKRERGRGSREENAEVLERDTLKFRFVAENRFGEALLALLEFEDAFFNGVLDDEASDVNRTSLTDAVDAVDRLRLNGRRPPRIKNEDMVGLREVQPEPSCLHRDQKDKTVVLLLESGNGLLSLSLSHSTIETHELETSLGQRLLQHVQHGSPLGEDD